MVPEWCLGCLWAPWELHGEPWELQGSIFNDFGSHFGSLRRAISIVFFGDKFKLDFLVHLGMDFRAIWIIFEAFWYIC